MSNHLTEKTVEKIVEKNPRPKATGFLACCGGCARSFSSVLILRDGSPFQSAVTASDGAKELKVLGFSHLQPLTLGESGMSQAKLRRRFAPANAGNRLFVCQVLLS